MTALPPGPKTAGFVLELPRFRRGVLDWFAGLSRRYPGPMVHVQVGPGATFMPNDPDAVRDMLVRVPEKMSRSRWLGELRELVGEGLLTSPEADWVDQRRRLNPAYRGANHRRVVDEVTRGETEALVERWRRAPGGVVDAQAEAKRTLLRAMIGIMFSPDVDADERRVIADLDVLLQAVSFRSQFVRQQLERVRLPWRGEAPLRAALARLDAFVADLIDGCLEGRYAPGLLLAQLLPAFDRGEVDRQNLHDEIGTLLLAGFDTTAGLVTFALCNLAGRPDLADAVAREAGQEEAPLTEMVLRETLRLYPTVWAIHRTAAEDLEIGGYVVPKGEHLMACPYALQRNPRFWPEPDQFVPQRFADALDNDALLGLEYLPFSHGRHTCIGKRMALQQARLMVGRIAQAFEIAPTGPPPRLVPGIILRADGGVPLRVTARS